MWPSLGVLAAPLGGVSRVVQGTLPFLCWGNQNALLGGAAIRQPAFLSGTEISGDYRVNWKNRVIFRNVSVLVGD